MRIDNLRWARTGTDARVSATVRWEDCARPALEIFFETTEEFARDLACDAHAFLVACLPPALRHGERRIAIDADICSQLREGLLTAARILQVWRGQYGSLVIEPLSCRRLAPQRVLRAGAFLSGGVDSLAMLRSNHANYPVDHPLYIKDCILAQRFGGADSDPKHTRRVWNCLSEVARETGVTLIPVRTNIKELDPDDIFWIDQFHGAALAATAHAFSNRFTAVFIASTYDIAGLQPLGSHPLLDPNYGSAGLSIRHDGITMSRLDKVRYIANWECALRNLDVCVGKKIPGAVNCGRCRKCLLTMTEFLVLDRLRDCSAFAADEVSAAMLQNITIENDFGERCYLELVEPLMARHRFDLVKSVLTKVRAYRRTKAWRCGRGWRGAMRRLERGPLAAVLGLLRELDETRSPRRVAGMLRRRLTNGRAESSVIRTR